MFAEWFAAVPAIRNSFPLTPKRVSPPVAPSVPDPVVVVPERPIAPAPPAPMVTVTVDGRIDASKIA